MFGKPWTGSDDEYVDRHYGKIPAGEIARALSRSIVSVYARAKARSLGRRITPIDDAWIARLKELNAAGFSDADIAIVLESERHTVSDRRKRLGLPSNAQGERTRAKTRAAAKAQAQRFGVSSIGEMRALMFRIRAIEAGWPSDLRWRSVQILELLESRGPMTREQIAGELGMPWKTRNSLASNDPEGSYLANLIRRGLVISMGRIVRGTGRGKSVSLYSIALTAERRKVQ